MKPNKGIRRAHCKNSFVFNTFRGLHYFAIVSDNLSCYCGIKFRFSSHFCSVLRLTPNLDVDVLRLSAPVRLCFTAMIFTSELTQFITGIKYSASA